MKTDPSTIACVPRGQVARIVGVSADALDSLTARGVLEPQRSPTGRWFYRPLDIAKAIEHFAAQRPK